MMDLSVLTEHIQSILQDEAQSLSSIALMKSMQFAGFSKILKDQSQNLTQISNQLSNGNDYRESSIETIVASTIGTFEKRIDLLEKQTRMLGLFASMDENDKSLGLALQDISELFKETICRLQRRPPKSIGDIILFLKSELKQRYRRCKHLRKLCAEESEVVSFLFKLYSKVLKGLLRKVQEFIDDASWIRSGEASGGLNTTEESWDRGTNATGTTSTGWEGSSDLNTTEHSMLSYHEDCLRRSSITTTALGLDASQHSASCLGSARNSRPSFRRVSSVSDFSTTGSTTLSSGRTRRISASEARKDTLRSSLNSMTSWAQEVSSVIGDEQVPDTISTSDGTREKHKLLFTRRLDDVLSRSGNGCLVCTLARPGGKASKCVCR